MSRTGAALIGLVACFGPLALAAHAEMVELKLKTRPEVAYDSPDFYLQMVSPQMCSYQGQIPDAENPDLKKFAAAIKKEPSKYLCEQPFRGVFGLGSRKYGFALDSTNLEKKGYNRLWFDSNHDGDLSDEKPITSKPNRGFQSANYTNNEFPRQHVEVETEGVKYEIAFAITAYANWMDGRIGYAGAQLKTANYREGSINIDGKQRRVVLLDFDSNGRFNDQFKADGSFRSDTGEVYASTGDMVLLDPTRRRDLYNGYDPVSNSDRQQLSKLLNVDGKYYTVKVSPAGDKLTIEPAKLALGALTNANGPYRAVIYGEQGLIKISGEAGQSVAVPVGEWKLLEYEINLTNAKPKQAKSKPATAAATEPAKPKYNKKSLSERLALIFGTDRESEPAPDVDTGPKLTLIDARGTVDYKAVKVVEGKTETLPFGPPYKPHVRVAYMMGERTARLDMKLIGSAGEACSNLMVKGRQPPQPTFKILDKQGELVEKGKFEYG